MAEAAEIGSADGATTSPRRGIICVEDELTVLEKTLRDFTVAFARSSGPRPQDLGEGELCPSARLTEELDDARVRLSVLRAARDVVSDARVQRCTNQVEAAIDAIDAWRSIPHTLRQLAALRDFMAPKAALAFDNARSVWLQHTEAVAAHTVDTSHPEEAAVPLDAAVEASTKLGAVQEDLEVCERSINAYLAKCKADFPRLYFVAARDLLDMLMVGAATPQKFNAVPHNAAGHFGKLFAGLKALEFADEQSTVAIGMCAGREEALEWEETLEWQDPVTCTGEVCSWLKRVEEAIQSALKRELRERLESYSTTPYREWVRTGCHQMTLVACAVEHTAALDECFNRGAENSLSAYRDQCRANLALLETLVKRALSKKQRKTINTLLSMSCQRIDEVESLIRVGATDILCYERQAQLQHRVERDDDGFGSGDTVRVRIGDCERHYGFEYFGLFGALVFTPATDKVYVGLTTAMCLRVSGLLSGPAGSGKSETTKDLARHFGVMSYTINCSDEMDYRVLGNTFRGLAACGSWGIFDEFNRIEESVLAIAAAQLRCIHDALRVADTTPSPHFFMFEGNLKCPLEPTVLIVATANLGYAGRTTLPVALRAEFRCFVLKPPDPARLIEGLLQAEGFSTAGARKLSRRISIFLKRSEENMSRQPHYDYGLRFVKSLLVQAGRRLRSGTCTEVATLREAVDSVLAPKLVVEDLAMLPALLDETLPCPQEHGVSMRRVLDVMPQGDVEKCARELGYQPDEVFVKKVLQLRGVMQTRHAIALLGPAGSGKTAVRKTLVSTLEALSNATASQSKQGLKSWSAVNVAEIYPKSMSMKELFGGVVVRPRSRQWADGALPHHFRKLANDKESRHQLLVLDGGPEATWIENMNTVMDDNRVLTLASNERISLTNTMRVLFEWSDARNLSPATVSRIGCCYVSDRDIGWELALQSWLDAQEETQRCLLEALCEIYLPKALDKARQLEHTAEFRTHGVEQHGTMLLRSVQTLCALLDATLAAAHKPICIHLCFVFACIWAVGGNLSTHGSKTNSKAEFSRWWLHEFDEKRFTAVKLQFRATELLEAVRFPLENDGVLSVFDCKVDGQAMVLWPVDESRVADSANTLYVETRESTRISFFFNALVPNGVNLLLAGGAGVGKTASLNANLRDRNSVTMDRVGIIDRCSVVHDFITRTSQDQMQEQHLTFFIDDFNVPADEWGDKRVEELVRSFIERHLYDPKAIDLEEGQGMYWYGAVIKSDQLDERRSQRCGTSVVAALNPSVGTPVDASLQRHFAIFTYEISVDSLTSICSRILCEHVADFNVDLKISAQAIASACAATHTFACGVCAPGSSLQAFSLRHISALMSGMRRCNANTCKSGQDLFDLFVHESRRVFRDALVSDEEARRFDGELAKVTAAYNAFVRSGTFPTIAQIREMVPEQQYLDHNAALDLFCALGPENNYVETSQGVVLKALRQKLVRYTGAGVVLFAEATKHLVHIVRLIDQPGGHAALIGARGTGKRTMARLAAHLCSLAVAEASTLEGVRVACSEAGRDIGSGVLLLVMNHADSCVLQSVSELMGSNKRITLFREEEFDLAKIRGRLRIVLCSESFAGAQVSTFPVMVFRPWSRDALVEVAVSHLSRLAPSHLEPTQRQSQAQFIVSTLHAVAGLTIANASVSVGDLLKFVLQYTTMLKHTAAGITGRRETIQRALKRVDTFTVGEAGNDQTELAQACSRAALEWKDELKQLLEKEQTLFGDTLLAAAFVCFAGPFLPETRSSLVDSLTACLEQERIPMASVNITCALCSPSDLDRWESQGLPCDDCCRQNAAVVEQTLRWPLLIDPHGQGLRWVRMMHDEETVPKEEIRAQARKRTLMYMNAMEAGFVDRIARAAENGDVVVVKVGTMIDAQLQPLIAAGKFCDTVRLGTRELHVDPRFRMYLFATIGEVPSDLDCTIVNFGVSESSLQQQVSHCMLTAELQEQIHERAQLMSEIATSKQMLEHLLASLGTDTSDFDDSKLRALHTSAPDPTNGDTSALAARLTLVEGRIDLGHETLREAVANVSLAITMILDLRRRNVLYQFNLSALLEIIQEAASISTDNQDVHGSRDKDLTKHCIVSLLAHVGAALDADDRLQFAHQICFAMEARGVEAAFDLDTLAFLSNSVEVAGRAKPKSPSGQAICPDWLPLAAWAACTALASAKSDTFGSLPDRLTRGEEQRAWKKWYHEGSLMPGDFSDSERLLLLRCLRPDLLHDELLTFVRQSRYCGEAALHQIGRSLTERLAAVKPRQPVLFLLGLDELDSVRSMKDALVVARSENVQMETVQLGQGRFKKAKHLLQQASDPKGRGGWVLVENVQHDDSSEPILPELIRLCETLATDSDSLHPTFRLFVSCSWTQSVSRADSWIPLLQLCTKLSTESPYLYSQVKGLQRQLKQCSAVQELVSSEHPDWGQASHAAALLHSVIVERQRYGPLCWLSSPQCGLTELDHTLRTLCRLLDRSLRDNSTVPWEEVRRLILNVYGESFGGDCARDLDQLESIAERYLRPIMCPQDQTRIVTLPDVESLTDGDLMLHPSLMAEFHSTKAIDLCRRSFQAFSIDTKGEFNDLKRKVVEDLLPKLDSLSSSNEATQSIALNELFSSEVNRMNHLLKTIEGSLNAPTPDERRSLLAGAVPVGWLDTRPGVGENGERTRVTVGCPRASLVEWLEMLTAHAQQLELWAQMGSLKTFWLPGFLDPTLLLTLIQQKAAKVEGKSASEVQLVAVLSDFDSPHDVVEPPAHGAFIHGLTIENARWDRKNRVLMRRTSLTEAVSSASVFPVIHIFGSLDEVPRNSCAGFTCPVVRISRATLNKLTAELPSEVRGHYKRLHPAKSPLFSLAETPIFSLRLRCSGSMSPLECSDDGVRLICDCAQHNIANQQFNLHTVCASSTITPHMLRQAGSSRQGAEQWTTTDKEGRTPLHLLCDNRAIIAELLLLVGSPAAQPVPAYLVEDNLGGTPLDALFMNDSVDENVLKAAAMGIFNVNDDVVINVNDDEAIYSYVAARKLMECKRLTCGVFHEIVQAVSSAPGVSEPYQKCEQAFFSNSKDDYLCLVDLILMRKRPAVAALSAAHAIEWLLCPGLWSDPSGRNPLSCAVSLHDKPSVELLVGGLVRKKMMHEVAGLQHNIANLLHASNYPEVGTRLLQTGGLLVIPKRNVDRFAPGDIAGVYGESDSLSGCLTVDVSRRIKGSTPHALHSIKPGDNVRVGAREGIVKQVDWHTCEVQKRGAENNQTRILYLHVQWDDDQSIATVKASKVSVWCDAPKWLDLRARVEAAGRDQASSAFEVDAILLAVRNAAKAGSDGLLGILLKSDTTDAFGTSIASILIDYKWNKFAKDMFIMRLCMHLLLVAAWTYLSIIIVSVEEPFAHVTTLRSGLAVALCAAGGAHWQGRTPRTLHMPDTHVITTVFSLSFILGTQIGGLIGLGGFDSNATVRLAPTAMVVLVATTSAGFIDELKQIRGAVRQAFERSAIASTNRPRSNEQQISVTDFRPPSEVLRDVVSGFVEYLADPWNSIDLVSLVLIATFIGRVLSGASQAHTAQIAALTSILLWFRFIAYFQGFEASAKFVSYIFRVTQDMLVFLCIMLVLAVGNIFVSQLLWPHRLDNGEWNITSEDREQMDYLFGDLGRAAFSSLELMFAGSFETSLLDKAFSPVLAYTNHIYQGILVPLIMLNLLIALMGSSHGRVEENEENEGKRKRAELISDIEHLLSDRQKETMFPEWIFLFRQKERTSGDGDEPSVADLRDKIASLDAKVDELAASLSLVRPHES